MSTDTDLPYQPLAILYQQLLVQLDHLSRAVPRSSSAGIEIEIFVNRFQLWGFEITSTKATSPAEVLQALDDTRAPVTLQLQDLFRQMLRRMPLAADSLSRYVLPFTLLLSHNQRRIFHPPAAAFSCLLMLSSSIIDSEIVLSRKLTLRLLPSDPSISSTEGFYLLWGLFEETRGLTHLIRTRYDNKDELKPVHMPGSVVLCLDGGGIKSYSSLLILKALLGKVCILQGPTTFRPRDHFDYIFGSSSGG